MELLVLIVVLIALFAAISESSAEKKQRFYGNRDEVRIARTLRKALDNETYKILHDVTLPSNGNTKNTQIDLIVLSRYGVFCIEVKGYSGWIFGTSTRKYWTHSYYGHKYRVYNPIFQNFAHIKAIQKAIGGLLNKPVIQLVAFPNAKKLRVDNIDEVWDAHYLVNVIKSYNKSVYSEMYVHLMTNHLLKVSIKNENQKSAHIQEVKQLALRD